MAIHDRSADRPNASSPEDGAGAPNDNELLFDPALGTRVEDAFARGHSRLLDCALVAPVLDERILDSRIARDLDDVRLRIGEARAAGKHVLYMPGKYDLVHLGHFVYVDEGVQHYLKLKPWLTREKLFVVVLADSDELLRARSTEHFRRPIESEAVFADLTDRNPRLCDLAGFDVDLVGLIPPPSAALNKRFETVDDDEQFSYVEAWRTAAAHASEVLGTIPDEARAREEGEKLRFGVFDALSLRLEGQIARYREEIAAKHYDPAPAERGLESPSLAAWQLRVHQYIAGTAQGAPMVRIVSERDDDYRHQVGGLMRMSGVAVLPLHDLAVPSTTSLLERFGEERLIEVKRQAFEAQTIAPADPEQKAR